MRRPGSISFIQRDKEESQHCASLLVTQHCGVAVCPLIVVSLFLLAETLFDWTRRPLRCSRWWTCFWFTFLHISQSLQMDIRAKQSRCSVKMHQNGHLQSSACCDPIKCISHLPPVQDFRMRDSSSKLGAEQVWWFVLGRAALHLTSTEEWWFVYTSLLLFVLFSAVFELRNKRFFSRNCGIY